MIIFLFVSETPKCQDGWTESGSNCYFTSLRQMSWSKAKKVLTVKLELKLMWAKNTPNIQ